MATATIGTTQAVDMVITFPDAGWDGLENVLGMMGDRSRPLIKYRKGALTLVSPSGLHERGGERLDRLVQAICCELDIAYQPTGSTLYRRKDLDHGIMADKSYYVANEGVVREVEDEIDLNVLPPPDLMIEVVVTHSAENAISICRALRIPEVWVYLARKGVLRFLHLDDQGQCVEASNSRAFPFLTPADALPWIESRVVEPANHWEGRLRAWVREVLGPRREGGR